MTEESYSPPWWYALSEANTVWSGLTQWRDGDINRRQLRLKIDALGNAIEAKALAQARAALADSPKEET